MLDQPQGLLLCRVDTGSLEPAAYVLDYGTKRRTVRSSLFDRRTHEASAAA